MARSRNIKPGFFKNDELAECDPLARLLFAGLWTIADREGRFEYRPRKIKAECLPYEDGAIDDLLSQLESKGFFYRYGNEQQYGQIVNWHKHQNPHHKEVESELPAPSEVTENTCDAQSMHDSCMSHEQPKQIASCPTDSLNLIPDSLNTDSLEGTLSVRTDTPDLMDLERRFVSVWNSAEGVIANRGQTLNDKRRRSFRARIRGPDWDWEAAIAKFPLKCFANDPDPWRPDVDWFLKPDSVQKILEGKYDWSKGDRKPGKDSALFDPNRTNDGTF